MVTLRAATAADADLLLAWRNDPATRAASFTTGEVDPAGHRAWLAARLADPACSVWIAEQDGTPIGQVRLDGDADEAEISVGLAPEARGRGLGAAVIAKACAAGAAATVLARVRPGNEASLRAFRQAGFSDAGATEDAVELRWAR